MSVRRSAVLALFCALVAFGVDAASATTIVPMSDRDLASSARAVVEARVVEAEPRWDAEHSVVYTYVTLDVERTYKGDVPPGLVVLRQLGGITAEHVTVIYGAPVLEPGERHLLFLNADGDGAMHVAQLSFGSFRLTTDAATGEPLVVRDGVTATESPVTHEPVTSRAPRAAFVADVLATVAAAPAADPSAPALRVAPPEYLPSLHRGEGAAPAFTFLGSGFRWFEPDSGAKVAIKVNPNGAPTTSGGLDEAKAVFQVWSSVSGSRLRLEYGGKTSSSGIKIDGQSAISFGDPRNQVDDLVNCQGIVAMSGIGGDPGTRVTLHGKSFAKLTEADLVVNNGIDCIISQWPGLFQEVLTHETGHCLGLGHSSESSGESDPALRDATMYWVAHNDGRGASIRADDSAAIRFAYGTVAGPLSLATDALPDAVPSQSYAYDLEAEGGNSPYTWSVSSGSLPSGITLSSNGRLSGTASGNSRASFTVRVVDGDGSVQTRTLTLDVTSTPSPFIASATYADSKGQLLITGRYFDVTANVSVNGTTVVPGAVVKYKASKGRLSVKGSTSALHVRGNGSDVVVVTMGNRSSNSAKF